MASIKKTGEAGLSAADIGEQLDQLELRMDRCKVLFEQYFLGIQARPPNQIHVELERTFRKLTQQRINNSALRFRFNSLSARFSSYNTYWKRTMRQIENGTYIRDIARVGRNAVRDGKDIPEEILQKMPKRMRERILKQRDEVKRREEKRKAREEGEEGKVRNVQRNVHQLDDTDLDDLDLDSIFSGMMGAEESAGGSASGGTSAAVEDGAPDVDSIFSGIMADDGGSKPAPARASAAPAPKSRPAPRKAPIPSDQLRAQAKAPPKVAPPPGMSEPDAQKLFAQYKKARQLVGESTSKLTYDKLMKSLNKQAPKIMKEHNAKSVSFNVVVKGDKVILKAKPKK